MTFEAYESLRAKGLLLAGGLGDLSQRACVYHHMYEDSGGRNVFPLIAAHGALWASGYFKKGMLGGKILSLPYFFKPRARKEKLNSLVDFANKFRDINRRVCAESYAIYHYTKSHGGDSLIRSIIGTEFTDILCECHNSSRTNTHFSKDQRETLFYAFFSWEQENIVAPSVTQAYDDFHWWTIKYLALRPRIDFSYFGADFNLQFKNFSLKHERIQRGLQAYHRAEEAGLEHVEYSMQFYKLMPEKFYKNPNSYFKALELANTEIQRG